MKTAPFQPTAQQLLLVSAASDITYLTGFLFLVPEEREAFALLTTEKNYLVKASFSPPPVQTKYEILQNCQPAVLAQHLLRIIEHRHITEVLVDPTTLFLHEYRAIEAALKPIGIRITTFERDRFWEQRMIKKPIEITAVRKASKIVVHALQALTPTLRVGVTEAQLCMQLEDQLRKSGSEKPAFPTIVAFGAHTAEPHHQPSSFALHDNMPVLVDVGATIDGYRSDMTRTWWFGETVDAQFTKIKTVVHGAYDAAFSRLSQPALAKDIDHSAREYIASAGFGSKFIHTTGHGVGLDIHEPPSLNAHNTHPLHAHMTITIEPGIYVDGKFGYRYENTVLLTERGAEELTKEDAV